jgi:two-component system, NarL family, response regulator YdfI
MTGSAHRAIVLSGSELLRAGLVTLGSATGLEIVGELESPDALDDEVRATTPDVVLAAPVSSDSDACYHALRRLPDECKALVLLGVPGFRIRAEVVRRRHGLTCLPVDADASMLCAALRELFEEGEERALTVEQVCAGPGGVLSLREQEVLRELAQGLNNRAIAERLFVSQDTVKSHLRSVYRKLGVSTRAEAVALYVGELGGG